jgi:hypothetical protein
MCHFDVEFVGQTLVVDQINDGTYKTQTSRDQVQDTQSYLTQDKSL